jgi:hypothetical protein
VFQAPVIGAGRALATRRGTDGLSRKRQSRRPARPASPGPLLRPTRSYRRKVGHQPPKRHHAARCNDIGRALPCDEQQRQFRANRSDSGGPGLSIFGRVCSSVTPTAATVSDRRPQRELCRPGVMAAAVVGGASRRPSRRLRLPLKQGAQSSWHADGGTVADRRLDPTEHGGRGPTDNRQFRSLRCCGCRRSAPDRCPKESF